MYYQAEFLNPNLIPRIGEGVWEHWLFFEWACCGYIEYNESLNDVVVKELAEKFPDFFSYHLLHSKHDDIYFALQEYGLLTFPGEYAQEWSNYRDRLKPTYEIDEKLKPIFEDRYPSFDEWKQIVLQPLEALV
jgi:hypothetical protein